MQPEPISKITSDRDRKSAIRLEFHFILICLAVKYLLVNGDNVVFGADL